MTYEQVKVVFAKPVLRSELPNIFKCTDREARKIISELQEKYNIVNLQDGKGYFLADDETALRYAKQERSRALKSYLKANRIVSRCTHQIGFRVPVRAHFRTVGGKTNNIVKNQIEMEF